MSKSRTRSGCFTCRKRKKKCDERLPVCSGCSRNFLQCCWPENTAKALPKDFKIKAAVSPPETHKEPSPDTDEYPVPANMCFVFELPSYQSESPKSPPRYDIISPHPNLHMVVNDSSAKFSWLIVAVHTLHTLETQFHKQLDSQTLDALSSLPDSSTVLNVFVRNFPLALFFGNTQKLPSPYEFYSHSLTFASLVDLPFASDWHVAQQRALLLESMETMAKLADAKTTKMLAPVRHKMTLTWTAIQTLEIQLPLQQLSESQKQAQKNLAVFKALFYSQEILYLKLADQTTDSSSPVVKFYLEQLFGELNFLDGVSLSVLLLPLLIGGCVADKMSYREFFSKELYIMAAQQNYPLAKSLAETLEDLWCAEQSGMASAYSWLISTSGH
ncbi:hypothetical protein OGAPHI_002004 [Ogataea philodendri]|uniref:Zn(2)-C6 fungal-type domain-containing protein n=1 Tax=Ogataea philodendri TaxID=1378263 RepID=A0A9P8PAM1_9ASCO|nr:uncharacterized protein OGAPHI_002004 [Ogataea philodendri]KAH3668250.1 hypothetical protein OGAPHI_002004 [Ogataea philodendri]